MEKKGEQNFFTSLMIKNCMKKVVTVNLHQTLKVHIYSEPSLRRIPKDSTLETLVMGCHVIFT